MAGKKIHYEKTYEWSVEIGFSKEDALLIAEACRDIDIRQPGDKLKARRHLNYNLNFWGETSPQRIARIYLSKAIKDSDLIILGQGLHSLQDHITHRRLLFFGLHWFGPWRIRGTKINFNPFYDPDHLSPKKIKKVKASTIEYLSQYLNRNSEISKKKPKLD